MKILKNHKFLTAFLIFVGVATFIFNFVIFQKLAFDSDKEKLQKALVASKADQASSVLPDIKKNEPITKSEIRNAEIKKVQSKLPYNDPEGRYSIIYYEKSGVLQVEINAGSIVEYRDRKAAAEVVLAELGADNTCNLVALWAVPTVLNKETTRDDLTTTGCPN